MVKYKDGDEIRREFYECDCHSPEHTVAFTLEHYPGEQIAQLSLEVQLIQWKPFYKRIWPAIKYLVGIKTYNSAHWDSWILNRHDVERLKGLVEFVWKTERLYEESRKNKAIHGEDKPTTDC